MMESLVQDPNIQELINEWVNKGRAMARAEAQAEARAEAFEQGRIEEMRLIVHMILAARSLSVTPGVCVQIGRERDLTRLESWVKAAVTARSLGDVFKTADEVGTAFSNHPRLSGT